VWPRIFVFCTRLISNDTAGRPHCESCLLRSTAARVLLVQQWWAIYTVHVQYACPVSANYRTTTTSVVEKKHNSRYGIKYHLYISDQIWDILTWYCTRVVSFLGGGSTNNAIHEENWFVKKTSIEHKWGTIMNLMSCLVHPKNQKIFKIFRYIDSYDICMEN